MPLATEVLKNLTAPQALDKKPQVAYKTEIIGGVVVHTPINQVLWGPGGGYQGVVVGVGSARGVPVREGYLG